MQLNKQTLLKNQILINNEWISTAETFEVINPATGETITDVANATKEHALSAIKVADQAFQTFKQTLAIERAAILNRWGQLICEHKHDIATILTSEMGKPLHEALDEVEYTASKFFWNAEEAKRIHGEVAPIPQKIDVILF